MIFEAISTLKDAIGSDISAIANFIEVRWTSLIMCNLKEFISFAVAASDIQNIGNF